MKRKEKMKLYNDWKHGDYIDVAEFAAAHRLTVPKAERLIKDGRDVEERLGDV